MADETYTSSNQFWTKDKPTNANGEPLVVYSTKGDNHPPEAFVKALEDYSEGIKSANFTVLKEGGLQEVFRRGFETVNQPIQESAQGFDKGYMSAANYVRGLIGKQPVQGGVSSTPLENITSQVNTPEKAGMTAGLIGGSALSAGLGGAIPIAARIAGAGLGYAGGQQLGGSEGEFGSPVQNRQAQISGPLKAAGLVAASEGAMGVLKYAMNLAPSQRAAQIVAEKIDDLLKESYPHLRRAGAEGIEELSRTPKGIQQLTQIGIDGFKEEGKLITKQFIPELNQSLPNELGKVAQNHLTDKLELLDANWTKQLNNFGNEELIGVLKKEADGLKDDVTQIVIDQFKKSGLANPKVLANVQGIMTKFEGYSKQLRDGAEILQALRASGQGTGFSPEKLQEYIATKISEGPLSPMMNKLGTAASRGALPGTQDIGRNLGFNVPVPFTGGYKLPLSRRVGTSYAGGRAALGSDLTSIPVDIGVVNEYLKGK